MMWRDLWSEVEAQSAITPTAGAAGTTDIEGAVCDMKGFEAVMAVVRMGAITASAVTSIKWQQGETVDDEDAPTDITDAADLEGTAITVADDDDDQLFLLFLSRPTERYVRIVVDRGTQNAVVASAEYFRYNGRDVPTTLTVADAVTYEASISPAEGTA